MLTWAAVEVLRRHYEDLDDEYQLQVDTWHTSGLVKKRNRVLTRLSGGNASSSAAEIAARAGAVLRVWANILTEHPITDLEQQIVDLAAEAADTGGSVDDEDGFDE